MLSSGSPLKLNVFPIPSSTAGTFGLVEDEDESLFFTVRYHIADRAALSTSPKNGAQRACRDKKPTVAVGARVLARIEIEGGDVAQTEIAERTYFRDGSVDSRFEILVLGLYVNELDFVCGHIGCCVDGLEVSGSHFACRTTRIFFSVSSALLKYSAGCFSERIHCA
jgi:hypothetical protein